jgi:hypothetical protein
MGSAAGNTHTAAVSREEAAEFKPRNSKSPIEHGQKGSHGRIWDPFASRVAPFGPPRPQAECRINQPPALRRVSAIQGASSETATAARQTKIDPSVTSIVRPYLCALKDVAD